MEDIVRIGNVELTEEEAAQYYQERKYICTSSAVWQIHYSPAQRQYYGIKEIQVFGIARRRRFYALDAETINRILNKKILIEN